MAGLGLVVSPGSMPSEDDLAALRPSFIRSIVYSFRDVERLVALGYPILLTVNTEMQEVDGWRGWEKAIRGIVKRSQGRVIGVCCGNEFDLYWKDNPADVPPEFAARLVYTAARILRPAGIKTIGTSVAGPRWQEYLERMADLCRDEADCFDFHPYGQRPDGWNRPGWGFGDLRPSLIRAYELAGKPVICSEIGVKIADAGGEQRVADFLAAAAGTVDGLGRDICPHAAWFAWHDNVGAPAERGDQAFGLMSEHGHRRPAWDAFASLGGGGIPEPTPDVDVTLPKLDVGWVGSGLQAELDRLGWTPTTDEHDETLRLVRAGEDLIVWDGARGALAYRRAMP